MPLGSFGFATQIEQPKNFILGQAQLGGLAVVLKNFMKQCSLGFEDIVYPLFDRIGHDHSCDGDTASGPDAVCPIDRLVFDGRIPPAVEEKDVAAEL